MPFIQLPTSGMVGWVACPAAAQFCVLGDKLPSMGTISTQCEQLWPELLLLSAHKCILNHYQIVYP